MALSQFGTAQLETVSAEPDFFMTGRVCPVCKSAKATRSVEAEMPAETLAPEQVGEGWRGFFKTSCFFTYCRCGDCGHLYSPTYVSEESLGKLYGSMGDNVHSGDEALSYLTQQSYVTELLKRARRATRYLEIGPDKGLFTKALQERLKIETAFMAEPNRNVWTELKACLPAAALIVPDLYDLEQAVTDNSLDLAVGIHVLDHVTDPARMARWVSRKLKVGGMAAFVVHNEGSLLARLLGRKWPAYCLQHPQLYNPASLSALLEKNGMADVTVCHTVNHFPLNYLIMHGMFAVTGMKPTLALPAWPVKLQLGNIMAVAVKKA